MKIDRATVLHIAELSALKLSEAEVGKFSRDLSAVVDYIETLNRADLGNADAAEHAMPVPARFRADTVVPSLPPAEILKNAPAAADGFFRVPRVL